MKVLLFFLALALLAPKIVFATAFSDLSTLVHEPKNSARRLERQFHKADLKIDEKVRIATALVGQNKDLLLKPPHYYASFALENTTKPFLREIELLLLATAGIGAFKEAQLPKAKSYLTRYKHLSASNELDNEGLFYLYQLAWVELGLDQPELAFSHLAPVVPAFQQEDPLQAQIANDFGRFWVADLAKKAIHKEYSINSIPPIFREQFVSGVLKELKRLQATAQVSPATQKISGNPDFADASMQALKKSRLKGCEIVPFVQATDDQSLRTHVLRELADCSRTLAATKSAKLSAIDFQRSFLAIKLSGAERSLSVLTYQGLQKTDWACDESSKAIVELDPKLKAEKIKSFLQDLNANCPLDLRKVVHQALIANPEFTRSRLAAEWPSLAKTRKERLLLLQHLKRHRRKSVFQETALNEIDELLNLEQYERAHELLVHLYPLKTALSTAIWQTWARLAILAPDAMPLNKRITAETVFQFSASPKDILIFVEISLQTNNPEWIELNWAKIAPHLLASSPAGASFLDWVLALPKERLQGFVRPPGEISKIVNEVLKSVDASSSLVLTYKSVLPPDVSKSLSLIERTARFEKKLQSSQEDTLSLIEAYLSLYEQFAVASLRPIFKKAFSDHTLRLTKNLQARLTKDEGLSHDEKQQIDLELKKWRVL